MKKTLALLLAAVMVFSLAACGNGGSGDSEDGKVTINFINGFTGGDGAFMTKIVDGFNNSQDKYFIEQLQDADHYTKFKTDGTWDMLIIHADWISTYHAQGLLRDVTDIYEESGISFENDFHEITKTYAKYDDGIFAFPLDLYAETFFYNKALVGDNKLDTHDDLIALRDSLDSTNSKIYPFSLPLTGDHQWAWMTALGQAGVNWVDGEHIKMDTQEALDAFMSIHELIYTDNLSAAGLEANDHTQTFINTEDNGTVRATFAMTGPWNYTSMKEVLGDDLAVGVLPQIYGDVEYVPAGGHTFAVSADCEDEEKLAGITEFFKYAYQPENLINWADSGQAPVHLATMEKVQADPEKYPVQAVNYTIFDDAAILPAIYNIREQVKFVNEKVWSYVISEECTEDGLMELLKEATKTAEELSVLE